MKRVLAGVVALGALFPVEKDAGAQSAASLPPVLLEWEAPFEGCPSRDVVLERVATLLRGSASNPHPVTARAVVSRRADAWHVDVFMRGEGLDGERAFDSESCSSVADAAAFALALAVDPTAPIPGGPAAPQTSPRPQPSPTVTPAQTGPLPSHAPAAHPPSPAPTPRAPAPTPAPASPERPAPSPRRDSEGRLAVGAMLVSDVGALPRVSLGAAIALAWRTPPWRSEVAGALFPARSIDIPAVAGASADFSLLVVGARSCYDLVRTPVRVGPCVSADVDRASASSYGNVTPLSGSATWVDLGAGTFVLFVQRPLGVRFGATALLPVVRPDFVVLQPAPSPALFVHRPSFVDGRVDLGLELAFL